MAYELKTNTATRIAVGPLVDPTDAKTAETALTVTELSVEIFKMANDGGAVVRAAFSPTASGGNNDMVHVTDDTTGMYDLEITAAQINWLGNGRIAFYDVDSFLVHWIDIQVVSAAYWDWKYGTTIPKVDLDTIKTQNVTCGAGVTVLPSVGTAATSTAQTGDSYAIVNSGTHGNAALKTLIDTVNDYVDAEIGALTTELAKVPKSDSNVTWNATALASINAEVDTALNTAIPGSPTADSINERIATMAGGVSLADGAITAAKFDEFTAFPLKSADTGATAVSRTGADSDTLETLSDQIDAISAAAIADAVWDEAIADHSDVGSTGAALAAAGGSGDPWSTALPGAYGAGTAGKILGDNLNAPVATIDTVVDAIKAKTDNLPAAPSSLDAAGVRTAVGLAAANLDTQLADIPTVTEMNNRTKPSADYFDPATDTVARVTLVDTCTTNTDMRGTNDAALASVCTEARLSELDAGTAGKAANQIDSIKTDTGTTLPAAIDAVPTAAEVKTALEAAGSHLTLIKAKTDKMTYTNGDDLDVNVQKINDVAVTGAGAVADPWGPA